MAAMELNGQFTDVKVMCVDSLSATAGIGLLLECAAENRAQGMTVEENAAWLEENRLRLCHWVMVEDLMYLKRGGRLSAATAVIGTALNIKPMLWIDPQGKLQNFAKVRGLKPALNQLLRYYENAREGGENERVYVVHSDNKEGAAYLAEEIRRRYPACRVTIQMLCPIIGAHTGPGLCAVVHFGNRES